MVYKTTRGNQESKIHKVRKIRKFVKFSKKLGHWLPENFDPELEKSKTFNVVALLILNKL